MLDNRSWDNLVCDSLVWDNILCNNLLHYKYGTTSCGKVSCGELLCDVFGVTRRPWDKLPYLNRLVCYGHIPCNYQVFVPCSGTPASLIVNDYFDFRHTSQCRSHSKQSCRVGVAVAVDPLLCTMLSWWSWPTGQGSGAMHLQGLNATLALGEWEKS